MSVPVTSENAGQFSAVAYTPIGQAVDSDPNKQTPLPDGWTGFPTLW